MFPFFPRQAQSVVGCDHSPRRVFFQQHQAGSHDGQGSERGPSDCEGTDGKAHRVPDGLRRQRHRGIPQNLPVRVQDDYGRNRPEGVRR